MQACTLGQASHNENHENADSNVDSFSSMRMQSGIPLDQQLDLKESFDEQKEIISSCQGRLS
jgi:hypothetical protein